jgi:uncharacterized protein (DUF433 family)
MERRRPRSAKVLSVRLRNKLVQPKIISLTPAIAAGRPVIDGTGISTAIIASRFFARDPVQSLALEYELSGRQIEEAIRWESQSQSVRRSARRLRNVPACSSTKIFADVPRFWTSFVRSGLPHLSHLRAFKSGTLDEEWMQHNYSRTADNISVARSVSSPRNDRYSRQTGPNGCPSCDPMEGARNQQESGFLQVGYG